MGRPTKIVVAAILGFAHGFLAMWLAVIALVFMSAWWAYEGLFYQVILFAQLIVGVLLIAASVVIMAGTDRRFYQVTVWLQCVIAGAFAVFPSGLAVVPFAIVLPLVGFVLLTRPDSRWYFDAR